MPLLIQSSRRSALKAIAASIAGAGTLSIQRPFQLVAGAQDAQSRPQARAVSGSFAAATVHRIATESAIKAFERGGNAFDAAIAAAFMLGVVDGHNSGIGGGCFVLARTADGKCLAIDGRETAPGLAHRDMYRRNGAVDAVASKVGALASGVPGQVAALSQLSSLHGRLGWADGLRDAAQVASEGFELSSSNVSAIRRASSSLRLFPASRTLLLHGDGTVPEVASTLRQPDLARSLTSLADEGAEWFYRGPFAAACDAWMKENGGALREADFANYTAKSRPPLVTRYRDWQVLGFPPPSSGGIHIAQMLMMLEPYDFKAMFDATPSVAAHLLAEVMKRAFADRA
ncbi:MAG: gamma-glutamyltransferase, partial [Planctomycetaceae bacterium]